jgi:glycerol-3-phosphate acyltransferase PlsX
MLPGLLLWIPALRRIARRMDYAEYGGAPLLGVDGVVIIAHGRSNAKAIRNAVRVARDSVRVGLVEVIRAASAGASASESAVAAEQDPSESSS